ncbi:unnamed protein product [Zymoseptoria tritici ST99CH_1E4]|uniref:Uncharacterized protein n=1 Tax=Zymoseptoria tritici ST99CH_1E4 TaxID=1276532 RepID=A0A2H1G5N5_ZYMTR|nr:unnamed protein product [Zymoseptoria tritici ST99CH_1E4]
MAPAPEVDFAEYVSPAFHHFERRDLTVNRTQAITVGVIGVYVVVIALLWNIPYVKNVLWPFKMLTIAFHEFGHALAAVLTGGKVESIELNPNEGGVTHMRGGKQFFTLPAGYLGSSLIGGLLVFCGFNIVASKVASIVLGVCFLLTLWWARKDWLTIVTIILATGLLVGMNSSDASVFAKRYGGSSRCWGLIWAFVSICFLAAAIVAGLAVFRQDFAQQKQDSDDFIPTR